MGVFNSVYFTCPNCGCKDIEEQFKPGYMKAWRFPEDYEKIPLDILRSLNNDQIDCYNCETEFVVKIDIEIKVSNPRIEVVPKGEDDES